MARWKNHDRIVTDGRAGRVIDASEQESMAMLFIEFDDHPGRGEYVNKYSVTREQGT
ncbi:Uncharacterised protein (plasmid) [Tsukamurella tyrosinosolvens]|uniref:Uncharacterized protein n=1 Tax=Tsukamurella tyrosinosolvens TaxID=57704 RepID=A0A1H4UG11_TSUTY|nr:hypothetical protein [Tsukamurella tyrosinosolvens]SEC67573.1 hypothetical protein SAMN04489793_2887 [Tsukamurella tyrosinosolvens]VEH94195.1 Uncharacterised protein [Tsukamurella tyrosinosolvens]